MNKTKLCRLCANMTKIENTQQLFERSQRKLLRQVEQLTGLHLKYEKNLPQVTCKTCQEQILQASGFRDRCIEAQKHFATIEYKNLINVPPIEEIKLIKRELEEDESLVENPTLIQVDINSNDSVNTFAKDCNDDQHDMLVIEPEISLCADDNEDANEIPVHQKNDVLKLIARKKHKSSKRPQICHRKKRNCDDKQEKKDFICDQCGIRYPSCSTSAFFMHKLRHAEKRYQCELCPKMYFTKAILNRHMVKHSVKSGEEPFPCKFCDRRFMNNSSKVRHERNHTNERPFACNECEKTFTQKQYLENHILTHTGERAFFCKWCNMSFKRKTHLVTHFRSLMHKQNEEKQQNVKNFNT